jgi:hypothetical protein
MKNAPAGTDWPAAFELAARFLAERGSDPRPWPETFPAWARAQDLAPEIEHDVRVCVIRARAFGAVQLFAGRGRRRVSPRGPEPIEAGAPSRGGGHGRY